MQGSAINVVKASGYGSDNLDDEDEELAGNEVEGGNEAAMDVDEEEVAAAPVPASPPKGRKRKLTKAQEAKAKAQAKKKAKGKKGGDDSDFDDDDDEDDPYTSLSKSMWSKAKPTVGNFENCARCKKQFTVVRSLLP
jgi:hypothetical protein